MMSRALTTLIKLSRVIKFTNIDSSQLFRPSGHPLINHCPGAFQICKIQAMSTDIDKELKDPKRQLDYKQLMEKKGKDNVVIIDVREHAEVQETGKIPGSVHIPLNDLSNALNKISNEDFLKLYGSVKPKPDDEVIFTCKSGKRSLTAMKCAFESGYTNAQNYKGGWLDWAENTQS